MNHLRVDWSSSALITFCFCESYLVQTFQDCCDVTWRAAMWRHVFIGSTFGLCHFVRRYISVQDFETLFIWWWWWLAFCAKNVLFRTRQTSVCDLPVTELTACCSAHSPSAGGTEQLSCSMALQTCPGCHTGTRSWNVSAYQNRNLPVERRTSLRTRGILQGLLQLSVLLSATRGLII